MKKAILAAGFGTTCAEADRLGIRPVEEALRRAYPDCIVRRAFTSRMIIRRLQSRGASAEGVEEALDQLAADGYGDIFIASTHIIPGGDYEKLCSAARGFRVSEPLLFREDDLDWLASLTGSLAALERRPLLLMGHGSDHSADEMYDRLRRKLPDGVYLACARGSLSLGGLLPTLDALSRRRLTLMPLMLAAGEHARNELAGDADDSWKSILAARGFDVRVRMQGLGELAPTARRFVEKAGRILLP